MMPIRWHGPMSEIRWTCKKKTNNYSFSKKVFLNYFTIIDLLKVGFKFKERKKEVLKAC